MHLNHVIFRGAHPSDQLFNLSIVQRATITLRPDTHQRVCVAADVAAANSQHVVKVRRREVRKEFPLIVEHWTDATLPLFAVAARAVRLVEVVAALHRVEIDLFTRRLHARGANNAREALVIEGIDKNEEGHHGDAEECSHARGAALAHDLRHAFRGETMSLNLSRAGETRRWRRQLLYWRW